MFTAYKERFLQGIKSLGENLIFFVKWVLLATGVGIITGMLGAGFYHCLMGATDFRQEHPILILGLPLGGLLIVFLYHVFGREHDRGTNTVIAAVRQEDTISWKMAPLIFIGTIITHFFGGSAGREGAALQMGGSIGNGIAKALKMDKKSITMMIMCGMSGMFAALFGTPMASAVFAMEMVSVGILYYAALVPCVVSSLVAAEVAKALGGHAEHFTVLNMPELTFTSTWKIVVLAMLCAGLSVVFCTVLQKSEKIIEGRIKSPYMRVVVAAVLIIVITALIGTDDYMGAGVHVIERAMTGEVRPEAFLLKMLLTALTLGAGFKGGEIVPTLFIGSTFGCVIGQLLGISPSLCAAVGMVALFCGVTNSPIASLLLSLEMFGMDVWPYMLLAVAISYMLSGYKSLYKSQKIVYSKMSPEFMGK